MDLPNTNKTGYTLRNLTDDVQTRSPGTQFSYKYELKQKSRQCHWIAWDEYLIAQKINQATLDNLLKFLADRCVIFESKENRPGSIRSDATKQENTFNKNNYNKEQSKKLYPNHSKSNVSTFFSACPHCKENHKLYSCKKFLSQSIASRVDIVRQLRLCQNCLRGNHNTKDCNSQGCKI